VLCIHNWCHTDKSLEMLREGTIESVCQEPLGGPLTVSKVYDLICPCMFEDVFETTREIVLGHLMEGEVPVLALGDLVFRVLVRINCSSAIKYPHIIALVNKLIR
jgi:hypothetical protein